MPHKNQHKITVMAIPITEKKQTLQQTKITKYNEGHFIIINSLIHREDLTILNTYAHKCRARKYMEQKWTEVKGKQTTSHFNGQNHRDKDQQGNCGLQWCKQQTPVEYCPMSIKYSFF